MWASMGHWWNLYTLKSNHDILFTILYFVKLPLKKEDKALLRLDYREAIHIITNHTWNGALEEGMLFMWAPRVLLLSHL